MYIILKYFSKKNGIKRKLLPGGKKKEIPDKFRAKKVNKNFLTLRNWLRFVAAILLLNIKLHRELFGLDRTISLSID